MVRMNSESLSATADPERYPNGLFASGLQTLSCSSDLSAIVSSSNLVRWIAVRFPGGESLLQSEFMTVFLDSRMFFTIFHCLSL